MSFTYKAAKEIVLHDAAFVLVAHKNDWEHPGRLERLRALAIVLTPYKHVAALACYIEQRVALAICERNGHEWEQHQCHDDCDVNGEAVCTRCGFWCDTDMRHSGYDRSWVR